MLYHSFLNDTRLRAILSPWSTTRDEEGQVDFQDRQNILDLDRRVTRVGNFLPILSHDS